MTTHKRAPRKGGDTQIHDALIKGGYFCPCKACFKKRLDGGAATAVPSSSRAKVGRAALEARRRNLKAAQRVVGTRPSGGRFG